MKREMEWINWVFELVIPVCLLFEVAEKTVWMQVIRISSGIVGGECDTFQNMSCCFLLLIPTLPGCPGLSQSQLSSYTTAVEQL